MGNSSSGHFFRRKVGLLLGRKKLKKTHTEAMNQHSQMWEELVLGKEECVRDVTVKNNKKKAASPE